MNKQTDIELSSEVKAFFESMISDYEGLVEAGLFD